MFFLFILLLLAPAAYSQTPTETRKELTGAEAELKASSARARELEAKNAALAQELKKLQQAMVTLARRDEEEEKALSGVEEKLTILEAQKQEKTQALAARQAELASALSAMVKLSQLPPEAVIAMPGTLDETLATARALSLVTHAVEDEAESLKGQIRELDALSDKINRNRKLAASRKADLDEEQKRLEEKVKERSKLQTSLFGKAKEEKERTIQLTEKSKDLQDLLAALERERPRKPWESEEKPPAKHSFFSSRHESKNTKLTKGRLHMPAAGNIVSRYGNPGVSSEFSKGMLIETRARAQVVAPYDGEVVFAGPFRDYGHMVIIRHGDNTHALLSGMEQIDCTPGQFLLEGEPVGTMSRHPGSLRLYVELRRDGKPVDPLPWFKG